MKESKIIPFLVPNKQRKKNKYNLCATIEVNILRNNERYSCHCYSRDAYLTEEYVYIILNKVLLKLIPKVQKIIIKKNDCYDIQFTILYFENPNNEHDYKYICCTSNISDTKLAEYIFTCIQVYNDFHSS